MDRLLTLPIEKISPSPFQPRQHFDALQLQELADSLKSTGLVQPIVVRSLGAQQYELIAGERRWRAAQLAGFHEVLCLVKTYSDEEAMTAALIENIQRAELNPIEEAQAYARLLNDLNYSHQELSVIIGKSRAKITNTLRLLDTDPQVQKAIAEKHLSEGHGKLLAGLPRSDQVRLAEEAVQKKWSVRQLEQMIKRRSAQNPLKAIATTPDLDVAYLETALSEQLGATVQFHAENSSPGGWLQIRYYDNDTLAGILERLKFQV